MNKIVITLSVTATMTPEELKHFKENIESVMINDFPEVVKEVAVEQVNDTQRPTGKSNISF